MSIVPTLPLSLQELVDYYKIAARECDFLISHLHVSLETLDIRMKPSAAVSVQFNRYEAYHVAFLEYLKYRLSPICIDESLEISGSKIIEHIIDHEYKHSGVSHPINGQEINPMLKSLNFLKNNLKVLIKEIESSMLKSIFICHATADKPKVRNIAQELIVKGAKVWIDEADILVGDSLLEKIQDGIEKSDYLGIVLSTKSVDSIWVKKEVEAALIQEISSGIVKVIPILIEPCSIPLFLSPKKYADLSTEDVFVNGISELVKRLAN